MNKKVSRLLEPSYALYFMIMILFVAVTFITENLIVGIAQSALVILLYIYYRSLTSRRKMEIVKYIEGLTYHVDMVTNDSLIYFPFPMVIIKLDTTEIIWANSLFNEITNTREHLFETRIADMIPGLSLKWLMEGLSQCPEEIDIGEKRFAVYGSVVRPNQGTSAGGLLATLYWMDITESSLLREDYSLSRPVACVIVFDNYEEIINTTAYPEQSNIIGAIDRKIAEWAAPAVGIMRKYERDRYFFVFEQRYLDQYISNRFSLLDSVRDIVGPGNIPVTVSIGIGRDYPTLKENYQQALVSIDMALSRGGDQAVIKNRTSFSFYGGRSKEVEKRTKVKSRVMANALSELIEDSSSVLVMGHKVPDIDAIGAACGVVCAARKNNRSCRIVCDTDNTSSQRLIDRLTAQPEYADVFISAEDALSVVDNRTLLIVVDTNRPEYTECEQLLELCSRVAVIDHHRRAATYIDHAALNFHEPYASSSCELVTELLQYIVEPNFILRCEAEAILAGIVLDTKNFSMRTGVRTFEAAAFLRRAGADTIEIKKIFQNDLDDTVQRYEIIKNARVYGKHTVIAMQESSVDRIVAAQAADELLNITDVQASFIIFPSGGSVIVSARSLGSLNVQVILEKLGGGGHMNTAGAQVPGSTVRDVSEALRAAIDEYMKKGSQ